MTSDETTRPQPIAHDPNWQTFIELRLSSRSDSVILVTDLVVGAVQTLNWAAVNLEQLKQAVSTAIQNIMKRSHLDNSGAPLIVRVFISKSDEGAANEPGLPQLPSAEAPEQVSRLPAHGWGFFLVQKQADAAPVLPPAPHHLIELFLYRESHRLFRR